MKASVPWRRPTYFARLAGALVLGVGALVLLGWAFGVPSLLTIRAGWTAMAALTALAFVLLGASLVLLTVVPIAASPADSRGSDVPRQAVARWLARSGAGAAVFIGLLTLGDRLMGWNLDMHALGFTDLRGAAGVSAPPRMADAAALAILMLACAVLQASSSRFGRTFESLALLTMFIGLLGILRYLYGGEPLIGYASMAAHTALCLLVLGAAVLCLRAEGGLVGLLASEGAGGAISRRLLFPALLLPTALGWLRLRAERAGWFGTEAGLSLFALSNVIVFGALVWAVARVLASVELEARVAERTGELARTNRRLIEVQESERRQLSRELHDRVGQNLTALGINLSILGTQGSNQDRAELRARLDDSIALVEATVDTIENVMSELRPPMLDDHGLSPALQWYAKQFAQRSGIEVVVRGEEPPQRPGQEIEITLFRIAQEALNNVAKHARATRVSVALAQSRTECTLAVSDNGVGFDPQAVPRPSRGMATMRERAQSIGGRVEIRSAPGDGTSISVQIPLQT